MSIINSKPLLIKKSILMTFICLCFLLIYESMFSWDRDYMQVAYSKAEHFIVMRFEFFDYKYGPANENGYIERCDFGYTTDGVNFINFMNAESDDQAHNNWSWLYLHKKLKGTRLQINGCYDPASGTIWDDNTPLQLVKVYNIIDKAYLTLKLFLDTTYQNVNAIKIIGKWHINGVWPNEYFNEVYTIPTTSALKSDNQSCYQSSFNTKVNSTISKDKALKVYNEMVGIVVKGADIGDYINVYTTAGAQIKSIIANNEVIKIKLPEKQIYIINIRQTHYKVSL